MAAKRVLMILSSHANIPHTDVVTGYSLVELAKPFFAFKNSGYDVEIASIQGGKPTPEPSSLDKSDPQVKAFLEDPHLVEIVNNTRPLHDFSGKNFCALYFVGGYGCMFDFAQDPHVDRIVREAYENGAIISGVCHGPIALANIRLSDGQPLVKNKKISGYTNEEEQQGNMVQFLPEQSGRQTLEDIITAAGGRICKGNPFEQHVAQDERIITGQNPQSAEAVAHLVIQAVNECVMKHGH